MASDESRFWSFIALSAYGVLTLSFLLWIGISIKIAIEATSFLLSLFGGTYDSSWAARLFCFVVWFPLIGCGGAVIGFAWEKVTKKIDQAEIDDKNRK
jgi:hypothetical protein